MLQKTLANKPNELLFDMKKTIVTSFFCIPLSYPCYARQAFIHFIKTLPRIKVFIHFNFINFLTEATDTYCVISLQYRTCHPYMHKLNIIQKHQITLHSCTYLAKVSICTKQYWLLHQIPLNFQYKIYQKIHREDLYLYKLAFKKSLSDPPTECILFKYSSFNVSIQK